MRGRYLMREYWSDSDLFLRLDAATREFYVGLWMLADDDGWLPRDISGIGAAIYQYLDRAPREQLVAEMLAKLREMGKVRSHRCCLYLPSVSRYPRAGKKSAAHHAEHLAHSKGFDAKHKPLQNGFEAIQTDLNPSPDVTPSLPDGSRAREDGLTPFQKKMRANGVKVPA